MEPACKNRRLKQMTAKKIPKIDYRQLYLESVETIQDLQSKIGIMRLDVDKWKDRASDLTIRLDGHIIQLNKLLLADGLGPALVGTLRPDQAEVAKMAGCRPEVYAIELLQCYQEGRIAKPSTRTNS